MTPDFKSRTIETVAKRAAYCCSNPECGATTIGPNEEPDKATSVGEAAHIHGARPGSARFDQAMTDTARAEITNAIWLCRNCHKMIDHDPQKYTVEKLFAWRESRENSAASKLGKNDILIEMLGGAEVDAFSHYPPIIRRIVIDRPEGWEWRLTAELLRHLNAPLFRKLEDLRNGLYTRPLQHISDQDVLSWVNEKFAEMELLVSPMVGLVDRLTKSWGKPGEEGDVDEIHHACCLMHDNLSQIVLHEEKLRFVKVSDVPEALVSLLRDRIGSQADKFAAIPDKLDQVVEMLSDPLPDQLKVISMEIEISLPEGWEKAVNREFKRVEKYVHTGVDPDDNSWRLIGGIIFLISAILFFLI